MQALSKALEGSRDPREITPSDDTPLDPLPRAILVTGTGNLVITGASGTPVSITIAAAPVELTIRPRYVNEASDIDGEIIGYW